MNTSLLQLKRVFDTQLNLEDIELDCKWFGVDFCNCGCHHDRDVNAARNILKYDSVRNTENSRGVVCKPNERTKSVGDCSDNCEATIELLQD